MSKRDAFDEVVKLVREGGDVSQEELVDAWSYAADAYNETYRLAKSLIAGYRAMQDAIRRKDALLEEKIRQLDNRNAMIWALKQRLRKAEGGRTLCAPTEDDDAHDTVSRAGTEAQDGTV